MADGSVTIDTKLNNDGLKEGLDKIGGIAKGALKGVAVAIGTVTTAFAGMVTASVKARGELEQNIGGVETLFKDSADKVIENANNAYKTAGLSANEYMQNVTSFSASLLQSTAGDTEKSAEIADMAMRDMSDNANKMGTDMASIQNAYQGFAKQNYTMLDNLKLGYGGTKTEMERLLKDAEKITGIKYDISNLSDVYEAIHVIQGELGITGTTALEAEKTLTGSINSLKASWNNFLSGSGDLSQVVDSVEIAFENILRIVNDAVPSIISNLTKSLPRLIELGGKFLDNIITGIIENLPMLMESAGQILNGLIEAIITYLPQLIPVAVQIIQTLLLALYNYMPQIYQTGIQIVSQLIIGIAQMLPQLIPQWVKAVISIVETILDNIDLIIDAGIELIFGLADGLIEALPTLIEKIPEIIEKIFDAIVRNLPKIVEAGIKLIIKLGEGLIQAIPQLVSKIPQIIDALLNGLGSAIHSVVEIGANIVKGLWQGIQNAWDWIVGKVKDFAKGILDGMMSALGIHSPSRVFRDKVGKNIALGVGEGFEDNISKVYRQMKSAVDFETQKLSANLSTTATSSKILTANINLNGSVDMDGEKVGRITAPAVSRTLRTAGA